jgi:rRNA maturation protein Nop10
LSPLTQNLSILNPKKWLLNSQKYGFNPGSGIRKKLVPNPGIKKAPDPGSATLSNSCTQKGEGTNNPYSGEVSVNKKYGKIYQLAIALDRLTKKKKGEEQVSGTGSKVPYPIPVWKSM